jgi:hypothetical protein
VTKSKFLAVERAKWRLKQRLETIDFEAELKERVAELQAASTRGELVQIRLVEG